MRLVVLAGLLRQICAAQWAAKVVLFMSSCDAVEFVHQIFSEVFELLEGAPLLPVPIFKLHGNLAQVCSCFGQYPVVLEWLTGRLQLWEQPECPVLHNRHTRSHQKNILPCIDALHLALHWNH